MAMLWLASRALPRRIAAATVDHGLRPEAAAEAEVVARACRSLGVPHATLRPGQAITGPGVQAKARAGRYALLRDWAVDVAAVAVATAHHLDDQSETFLMRAVRGAGPAGLASIRPCRSEGATTILRPLLGWRRSELAAVAAEAGLPVVADPSNADERYERVRVRRLLAENPWLDPVGLTKAARHASEAEASLGDVADQLWRERTVAAGQDLLVEVGGLTREMRRRLARRAISERSATPAGRTDVEPLLDSLAIGRAATQGDVLVRPDGDVWRFSDAPPRRSARRLGAK